ncbi:MAG: hypothetical protein R3F17_08825 [Planctomycetota bacterium]
MLPIISRKNRKPALIAERLLNSIASLGFERRDRATGLHPMGDVDRDQNVQADQDRGAPGG